MKHLFGTYLREFRGTESRLKFAKRISLSYTFVREMELGNRLPSDAVLLGLAGRLAVDEHHMVLLAYCDRSPALVQALREPSSAGWLARMSAGLPAVAEQESRALRRV